MSDPDRLIWEGMLSHLRANHAALTRQWFGELDPLGVSAGRLHLRARTDVHRDYLRRSCADAFNDSVRTVSGRLLSVNFLGPDDDLPSGQTGSGTARRPAPGVRPGPVPAEGAGAVHLNGAANGTVNGVANGAPALATTEPPGADAPTAAATAPPERVRRDESLVINPDYNFENFVVGPGNRMAHAAAVAVGNEPGRAYNPLFIHGGVGLGKTHLLQAVCLKILESNPGAMMYYISCESFVTQFIDAVRDGEMGDFRHRFRDVDVLVIDDIHFLTKRDRTQEEFFHTFNSLYQAGKQIVISSDAPPQDIPDLEDRLVSRFKWGLVVQVQPPCYETRVAILKTKAKVRGIEFPDDVACYIAARIDTNIRELEGAVTRIQMQSNVEKRPIDLDLAKAALGDSAVSSEPTIQTIINVVADYYHVKITDLQSKRRPRSVAHPRQVCMYFARRLTRHSLQEIGGYFGGRDHTTVMHAVKKVEGRLQGDQDFASAVKSMEDRVRPARAG